MAAETQHDIIIIGGGPAGSTAASFLSMHGHRVLLLEKAKFPRDHVGESLLPFCYKLFEQLGVLEQMKQTFVRKPGVRFVDSEGIQTTTWCFSHVIHDETYLSFQVARSEFDTLLLDNARRLGATIREERRVINVDGLAVQGPDAQGTDGAVTVQAHDANGELETYTARFLLDCSGRDAFIATRQRLKKKYPELDRTAFWTHYGNGPGQDAGLLQGGLDEGLSLIIYLGGEKKGWIWIFPLKPNRLTVGVVLNNAYIRAEKAKFESEGASDWRMALYEQELGYSPFAARLLANATILQPLTVEGDYSYFTESKYGQNYAIVGDAATFIDPIFSSGVYLAMNGARLVSNAVHQRLSALDNGHGESLAAEDRDVDPLAQAYKSINGAYKLIFKLINFFYSVNTINFAQMSVAVDAIHKQHKDAMAVGHFLLAGDFFERYDDYGQVIDFLHSPGIFEVYKKMVINRSDFQALSCEESADVVFHGL